MRKSIRISSAILTIAISIFYDIGSANASEGCGTRNVDGIGFRITGARTNETEFGEFPWIVAIIRDEKDYLCSGSLIHPSIVLTAAHCVYQKPVNSLTVRAGDWDTQTTHELLPHEDRQLAEVVSHEHYDDGSHHNDIALLFLKSPFELMDNVGPICLPPSDVEFDQTRCFASGWGKDPILNKFLLPIVPRAMCQSTLRTTPLGRDFELHSSFICAGGEKGTCKGDGGSPLVCPIGGKMEQYYQIGIAAWKLGCDLETPGVYTSIPVLRGWLDEKLASRKIDSKFYTAV